MSLGDLWSRTLVYFGIAEEDEDLIYLDVPAQEYAEAPPTSYEPDR